MSHWTKEADWLPISNAMAQVRFWKKDLLQAEEELDYVQDQMIRYPTLDLHRLEAEAVDDVTESQEALQGARAKLRDTIRRIE